MKILILNSILRTADNKTIPPADTIKDSMIYNLGIGFKNNGHDVTLIASKDYQPSRPEEYKFEVIFQKTQLKKIFLPSAFPLQLGLIKYLRNNKDKFDLIISSEVFAMPSLFAMMVSPANTLIWHEVNVFPKILKKIPAKIWYNIIVKLFFKHSRVVGRSYDARDFIRLYIKNVSETIIEHGVNLEKFVCSKEKDNQFIVISQLIPRKNIECIIEKFNAYIHKYSKFDHKLLIAGRGCLESKIRDQIKNLNLENNVVLLGHIPHKTLGALVAKSIALLIDTKQDLNMVSIPEAIVSGTPVVTNTIPTTASFIQENNLGIVKDNWDEDDLHSIETNMHEYIDACIKQRNKLSVECSSQLLIKCFNELKDLQ